MACALGGAAGSAVPLVAGLLADPHSTARYGLYLALLPLGGSIAAVLLGFLPILMTGTMLSHYRSTVVTHMLAGVTIGIFGSIALNIINDVSVADVFTFLLAVPSAVTALLIFRYLEEEARHA